MKKGAVPYREYQNRIYIIPKYVVDPETRLVSISSYKYYLDDEIKVFTDFVKPEDLISEPTVCCVYKRKLFNKLTGYRSDDSTIWVQDMEKMLGDKLLNSKNAADSIKIIDCFRPTNDRSLASYARRLLWDAIKLDPCNGVISKKGAYIWKRWTTRDSTRNCDMIKILGSKGCKVYLGGIYSYSERLNYGQVVDHVKCRDIVSAYPFLDLALEKMPFNELVQSKKFNHLNLNTDMYFSVFKVRVSNMSFPYAILPREYTEESELWITNVDYNWMKKYCVCDKLEIVEDSVCYWSPMLPIKGDNNYKAKIKELYERKNALPKSDPRREVTKKMLNIIAFGASVTGASRDLPDKAMDNQPNPLWGYYIAAKQREREAAVINALGRNFIYGDTDSVYYTGDVPESIFEASWSEYGYDLDGKLGKWKQEVFDASFKFMGVKRYMYKENGEYVIKCAGCRKELLEQYLNDKSPDDWFAAFDDDLVLVDNERFDYYETDSGYIAKPKIFTFATELEGEDYEEEYEEELDEDAPYDQYAAS